MAFIRTIVPALLAAGLATAYTPPTTASWGPLLTPDLSNPVTQGQPFTVTWDPASNPTDGVTVSLVLCRGSSTNCVTSSSAIAEGIPAAQKSYTWNVPCDLAVGQQSTDTGYGMLVIVDGSGVFQYSTQFSVLQGSSCSNSASTSSSASSVSSGAVASSAASTSTAVINTTSNTTVTLTSSSGSSAITLTSTFVNDNTTVASSTLEQTTVSLPTAPVTSPTVTATTIHTTSSVRRTTSTGTATGSASASSTSSFNEARRVSGGVAGVMLAGVAAVMMAL